MPPFASAPEAAACPVDIVLSLHREGTSRLLRSMRSHHVTPALSHPWGSSQAYLSLLRSPDPLALLDVPEDAPTDELEQRVHVLSDFCSVIVLTPGRQDTDAVPLLRAGAANVLPRDTPPRELASRITAERRWLDISAARRGSRVPACSDTVTRPRQTSQQLLLEVLLAATRPWCCHDLCLLLSTSGESMSRRALQARVMRLAERLAQYGMSVGVTPQWGRVTYTGVRTPAPA